jgi:methyl-accepting chemotaxis protein
MAHSSEITDRLQFIGWDQQSQESLAEFMPVLEKNLPDIIARFYRHLAQFPRLAGMFKGPAGIDRAAKAQQGHWMALFSGRFDDAYIASVRRIGLMHSRIGLEPRWYIGGYGVVQAEMYTLATTHYRSRLHPAQAAAQTAKLMRALNQAVMLDIDIAISIYIEENKASFDKRIETLAQRFEAQFSGVVGSMAGAATTLKGTAEALSGTAEQTSAQATVVAGAAEQANAGVQTVATAAEELTASINEISRQVTQSSRTTDQAVESTRRTDAIMQALATGAEKIGDVVGLISQVAAQTNLLALNATIEAARAGDAGKGFAVVASEVKNLAAQTTKATETISQQVHDLQSATQQAVQAIGGITQTISEINQVATAIAAAIEEQGAATQEIARSIQDVAAGTREVSANITGVGQGAKGTGETAVLVLRAAEQQAREAEGLRGTVRDFLADFRAA